MCSFGGEARSAQSRPDFPHKNCFIGDIGVCVIIIPIVVWTGDVPHEIFAILSAGKNHVRRDRQKGVINMIINIFVDAV